MQGTALVICSSERDRLRLKGLFQAFCRDAFFAEDFGDALPLLTRVAPSVVFLADGEDPAAEIQLQELRRLAPLLPVIVLLKRRDAGRALALSKSGALDCAQYPWTPEELGGLYRRAMSYGRFLLEPEPSKKIARRRRLAAALAAACALAGFAGGAAFGWLKFSPPPPPPKYSFPLPYSHATGIVVSSGTALISDWHTQALYEHDLHDFTIRRVLNLPDVTPVALAAGRDSLWLARADGVVEKRGLDARFTPLVASPRLSPAPDGACFDGLYVWTADSRSGTITRRLPADALAELKSFRYPGRKLAAFACDGNFLWAADPGLRSLVKMSLDDPETILSRTDIPAYASGTLNLSAMALAEGQVWFVGEDRGRGLAFRLPEPR